MSITRLLPFAVGATLVLSLAGSASALARQDLPFTDPDRVGDVRVNQKNLGRTKASRAQARSADVRREVYSVEDHDGEASARIEVRYADLAKPRPKDYYQLYEVYFDEYAVLRTRVDQRTAAFVNDLGTGTGCSSPDVVVTGDVLVQWIPVRCLPDLENEIASASTVLGVRTTGKGTRRVGADSSSTEIRIDWP